MTDKCIVSDWFSSRAKLNIQTFMVDDYPFEIMVLSDEAKGLIGLCDTHKEMVNLASNEGLSSNRSRVMDNEEYAKDIDMFWADKFKDDDSYPCVRSRVGEKVCEISGLSTLLNDMLETEKAADLAKEEEAEKTFKLGDGDEGERDVLASETMGNLSAESLNADAAIYANA